MRKLHKITLTTITLLVLTLGSGLLIVPIELLFSKNPLITNSEEGMWWAVTTITGVGYGDFYPTSLAGRVVGSILEIGGVTLFGITIALVTIDLFRKEQQYYWSRTTERFDRIEEKLSSIESKQTFDLKKRKK
ncbi:potassium channel family protein [Patescibacteria group bacterium]